MSGELEPIEPQEAVDLWIDRLEATRADQTRQSYRYRLKPFVEWCESEGIDNLNELTGRDIYRFDSHRRSDGLKVSTLNNQIGTLKQFIGFCEQIDAVQEDLRLKVEVPSIELADRVDDELLTAERAKKIRADLERYHFASRRQAIFELLWHTGCRLGGLHALDLQDWFYTDDDLERLRHRDDIDHEALEAVETPFVYFRHRPTTPLKNQRDGERPVALDQEVADRVQEYIEISREPVTDQNGRKPLITTSNGRGARASKSGIRRDCYIITQPCHYGLCPHDRDESSCSALEHGKESRCPSSRSPHPVRSGAITHMRDLGWPPEVVGERVNATPEVIREHYDHPDPMRRMQSRREFLQNESESE